MLRIGSLVKPLKNLGISLGIGTGVRRGCEKLVSPELLRSVSVVSEQLKIPKTQARDVLSLYQRYLKSSSHASSVEFTAESIENHVESFFFNDQEMGACFDSLLMKRFKQCFGLDILKSMIRTSIHDISPEAKAVLNDLKYYGLDSKSAEIVQKCEQNGIELITSGKLKKHNILVGDFVDKLIQRNLDKPKNINMFKNNMSQNWGAQFCSIEKNIEINPSIYSMKDYVWHLNKDGTKRTEQNTMDSIIHEYFHLLHSKTPTYKKYNGKETLFTYLCNRKIPDFGENTRSYLDYVVTDFDALGGVNFQVNPSGDIKCLDKAVDVIKKHADDIFGEDAQKALEAVDESYAICREVASSTRQYATANQVEAVAVIGGEYKFKGIKLPKICEDLLTELECPQFSL